VTRIFISWGGGGDSPLVSTFSVPHPITEHDPSFSVEAFVPFAEAVFLRVNRARTDGRLDEVRRLLADGQRQAFEAEGPAPERAALVIGAAEVTMAGHDGTWDSVVVRFTARGPGRRGRSAVEDWTFQRPVRAASQDDRNEGEEARSPAPSLPVAAGEQEECPVCGAPLSLTDQGTCRYCGAAASGGLGGWRLVRMAAAPAAARAPVSASSLGGRAGCALAVVITALALVPTVGALILTGVGVGIVQRTLAEVPGAGGGVLPAAGGGQLTGRGSFTGALDADTDGDVTFAGAVTGPCTARARQVTGVTFTRSESSDGGRKVLLTRATLPAGTVGSGTYDLSATPMQISANYSFFPDRQSGGGQLQAQVWRAQPGKTRAVLVIRPNGSGTLTVSDLVPSTPQPAASPLGQALNFTESFSCS
jgi:hypothetical protein